MYHVALDSIVTIVNWLVIKYSTSQELCTQYAAKIVITVHPKNYDLNTPQKLWSQYTLIIMNTKHPKNYEYITP